VEISENSENHLKAIVGGRQMAGLDAVSDRGGKVVGKTQGEGKALKNGDRGWQLGVGSANYVDLWEMTNVPLCPRFIRGWLRRLFLHADIY
jgi:hypothetical protein